MTFSSAAFQQPLSTTEFVIYSFEKDEFSKGSPVWQEVRRVADEREAVRRADALYLSRKFTRIEVRKRGVDAAGVAVDEAVKVLGTADARNLRLPLFFAGFGLCSLAAFVITLYA